jgi:hypothetical protein
MKVLYLLYCDVIYLIIYGDVSYAYYTLPTLGHIRACAADLVNERSALAMF